MACQGKRLLPSKSKREKVGLFRLAFCSSFNFDLIDLFTNSDTILNRDALWFLQGNINKLNLKADISYEDTMR